jgi:hypothetical protein
MSALNNLFDDAVRVLEHEQRESERKLATQMNNSQRTIVFEETKKKQNKSGKQQYINRKPVVIHRSAVAAAATSPKKQYQPRLSSPMVTTATKPVIAKPPRLVDFVMPTPIVAPVVQEHVLCIDLTQ